MTMQVGTGAFLGTWMAATGLARLATVPSGAGTAAVPTAAAAPQVAAAPSPTTAAAPPPTTETLAQLEQEVGRLRGRHDDSEKRYDGVMRAAGQLDGRMATLSQQIQSLQARDTSYRRMMNITNWAGKIAAGVALAGMGTMSASPLYGFGLFMGGLAGFCGCYVWQMKVRVRNAQLTAGVGPLSAEFERCAQQRTAISQQASTLRMEADAAKRALDKGQGRLDVVRMAHAVSGGQRGATVDVGETSITIGNLTVPRNTTPAGRTD